MPKIPRKLSLVKFDAARLPRVSRRWYPFRPGSTYVFLGEIPNMPGHSIVADQQSGRIYSGYHTDHFIELKKGEM